MYNAVLLTEHRLMVGLWVAPSLLLLVVLLLVVLFLPLLEVVLCIYYLLQCLIIRYSSYSQRGYVSKFNVTLVALSLLLLEAVL